MGIDTQRELARVLALALYATAVAVAAPAWGGETMRVSVASDGTQANGGSAGFLFGTLNASGNLAVFSSQATNLVTGDTNALPDVFVRDLRLGETTRVSVTTAGAQSDGATRMPTISGNGRWVAFQSGAGVPVDRHDRIRPRPQRQRQPRVLHVAGRRAGERRYERCRRRLRARPEAVSARAGAAAAKTPRAAHRPQAQPGIGAHGPHPRRCSSYTRFRHAPTASGPASLIALHPLR